MGGYRIELRVRVELKNYNAHPNWVNWTWV